jgi:small subunit ribosomal protein S20
MANTVQARKRARQALAQRAAASVFQASMSVIDSIADKKIIHKNKAARHKSRLAQAIKSMA